MSWCAIPDFGVSCGYRDDMLGISTDNSLEDAFSKSRPPCSGKPREFVVPLDAIAEAFARRFRFAAGRGMLLMRRYNNNNNNNDDDDDDDNKRDCSLLK